MALKPYSVSPCCFDQTVGPKPIMYLVTRTLNSLAGQQVPHFVQGDGHGDADRHEDDTEDKEEDGAHAGDLLLPEDWH